MAINTLSIENFRIHSSLRLGLKNGITVLTGPNGSGKTSILEAVSLLASSRSFRSGKNVDFIKKGMTRAYLEIEEEDQGVTNSISMEIDEARKKTLLNQKTVSKRRYIAEKLPFVAVSPADLKIIDSDASERRAFLDHALSNLDHIYADTLRSFQKVLFQRNRMLKDNSGDQRNVDKLCKELAVWNAQFVQLGAQLMEKRSRFIRELSPIFAEQYSKISRGVGFVQITYDFEEKIRGLEKNISIENYLENMIEGNLKKDVILCSTSSGPHRDEISLTIDENKVKFYGSQGEKRTTVLALKLAEVELFWRKRGKDPILLIDDVSSELDIKRRQALIDLLKRGRSQALITATELPADLLRSVHSAFDHLDLTK